MNTSPSTSTIDWFTGLEADVADNALLIRQLIFKVSSQIAPNIQVEESLKWGMPSFQASDGKGTPVRLGYSETEHQFGLYVHCQTSVMAHYAIHAPTKVSPTGNRGILFNAAQPLPQSDIIQFASACFNYRR